MSNDTLYNFNCQAVLFRKYADSVLIGKNKYMHKFWVIMKQGIKKYPPIARGTFIGYSIANYFLLLTTFCKALPALNLATLRAGTFTV